MQADKVLADFQFDRRSNSHNRPSNDKRTFEVGENVFLKKDLSKYRAREMYKIVELFQKNEETWVKLQKSNSQFRAKQYEVKTSEI